jgi:Tetratricopeptide repeat
LAACEAVKPVLPDIAETWNYLGIIYDTLGDVELAIDAYIKAVQLDPDFAAGRQNLRNANVRLEGEQYHRAANLAPEETQALCAHVDQAHEAEIIESEEPIPGWYYLDETAYLLPGWPGYRTRPGRSGYDQLDSSYELSHIEGVIIRKLLSGTMRTRNPILILYMAFIGFICCLPLLMVWELLRGDFVYLFPVIIQTPVLIVGIMLLVNVFLSLVLDDSTEPDDGNTFFQEEA